MAPDIHILVITDSKVSLLAIRRYASGGKGRTRDLVEVVDEVGRRSRLGLSTQFGWVKAHVGIEGNERFFFFFFKSNHPACGLDHGRDSGAP